MGFTPNLLTGIWVGYDRPKSLGKGFTGGAVAAPIWERFMSKVAGMRPAGDFSKPETVVSITVDPTTGLPAREECPLKQDEYYIAGTEPIEFCPNHAGEPIRKEAIPEDPALAPSAPADSVSCRCPDGNCEKTKTPPIPLDIKNQRNLWN